VVIPLAIIYLNPLSINPPLHPLFPYDEEQSTNSYSDNDINFPVVIYYNPSVEQIVEKAQHDPHFP